MGEGIKINHPSPGLEQIHVLDYYDEVKDAALTRNETGEYFSELRPSPPQNE